MPQSVQLPDGRIQTRPGWAVWSAARTPTPTTAPARPARATADAAAPRSRPPAGPRPSAAATGPASAVLLLEFGQGVADRPPVGVLDERGGGRDVPGGGAQMPVTEQLLDGDQVHAALIEPGGAGMPQRVRAEPLAGLAALQLQQVPQPVADAAGVHPAAALVAKQRLAGRAAGKPWTHVVQIPAQHQVQVVQHRHPAGPGPRALGSLAVAHMQLAEWSPVEVHVADLQADGLL